MQVPCDVPIDARERGSTGSRASTSSFPRALLLGCLLATLSSHRATAAALQVVAGSPTPNAVAAAATTIRIDFDRALDLETLSADTVRVFGRGSGTASGPLTLSDGDRSVTLTPARPFSAGETVLVNLAHALAAADGSPLRGAGYALQFTVATAPTTRSFQLIDTISNRSSPGNPRTV